jgi:hypothetical protein
MAEAASPQDRRFYFTMALLLVVLVAAGFAPSFYVRGWLDEAPQLPPAVRVHGVVGTAWVLLFAIQ